jgi:hypothetical protein
MTLKTIFTALGIGLATIAVPAPAIAKDAPVYTGTFNNTAVSGYDTVAVSLEGCSASSGR